MTIKRIDASTRVHKLLAHDWKKHPLKFDPNRGYSLCEPCWNGKHWDPPWTDQETGKRWPKASLCLQGGCGCGCRNKGPAKIKFTGEGQTSILDLDIPPLEIK